MDTSEKKRNVLRTVFLVLAGLLLGLLAGIAGIFLFSRRMMMKSNYVPVQEVLAEAGYHKENAGDDLLRYVKDSPEVTISISKDRKLIRKNDYSFTCSGELMSSLKTLYVRKSLLEKVLNVSISKGGFPLYKVHTEKKVYEEWPGKLPLIAHAGGGLLVRKGRKTKKQAYTNTLESFVASYDRGLRNIEMDFCLTTDDVLVAAHGWKYYDGEKSFDEFMKDSPWNLTPMSFLDVLDQMEVNPDVFLILDLKTRKWNEEDLLSNYQWIYEQAMEKGGADLLDRIVPQIYGQEEYDLIRSVCKWKNIIYTLYREEEVPDEDIISFINDKDDIKIVTMPKDRVNSAFSKQIHAAGKKVYTHVVDDLNTMYRLRNKGVDGVYTNIITPASYELIK